MTKAEKKIEELKEQGWKFDHTATVKDYRSAGSVSSMVSKNGFDYCRVHEGKCVGKGKYQLTTVMYRKED